MHLPQSKMIELRDVTVAYGNFTALEGVSLAVNEGDFMAITGPNGGGKTTLLKVILQLMRPARGEVVFRSRGHEVKSLRIGYLPQSNTIDSRFPITVEEVVSSGLLGGKGLLGRYSQADRRRVGDTLELVGLADKRRSAIGELSGGQLQRALLGRALISSPPVLALDEPLSFIDKQFEPRLYEIISDFSKHSTVLLVSHEMTTISQMANRHIIVDHTLHDCRASRHFYRTDCE